MSFENQNQEVIDKVPDESRDIENEIDTIDPEESAKELTELERMLLVEAPAGPIDPLTMDDTSHTEISQMANKNYSAEIIEEMNEFVKVDHLRNLGSSGYRVGKISPVGTC